MDSTDDTSFSAHGDGSGEDISPVPDESTEPDDSDNLETVDDAAEGKPAEFDGEDDEYSEDEDSDGPQERADDDELLRGDEDAGLSDTEAAADGVDVEDDYDDTDADSSPPAAGTSLTAELYGSEAGDIVQIGRDQIGGDKVDRDKISVNVWTAGQKEDDDRSLVEFADALPPKGLRPDFASDDLGDNLDKLKAERLILVSCPDEEIAFSAAYALIDRLELPKGGKRLLLNLSKNTGEGSQPSVGYLRRKDTSYKDTVVLVDAATEKARQFLEPIIRATPSVALSFQHNLRQNKMYMLCLVDPAQLEDAPKGDGVSGQTRELKFHCWRVPFLRSYLEHHHVEAPEEVESRIKAQSARKWWGRNESELYFELKSLLLQGKLAEELERRDNEDPGLDDKLFKGDELLSSVVLYVATFFPNLTPYEFNRLVPLLLSRALRADDDAAEGSKDDPSDSAASQRGKAALQVWRNSPDSILKDCSLVTVPLRGSTKGVNFSDLSIRDSLRMHLDKEYNFFLENRFRDVRGLGLIFSPSTKVSQGAVQLGVEMAASYPEYYGSRWVAGTVAEFESAFADGAEARATSWPFIEETNAAKTRKRFYQSMSELVRAMLERDTPLSGVVEEFLRQLLLQKHRRAVLEIVRRLQFAQNFDQFKWLKRLLDSGDKQTIAQTVEYLRNHLRRIGGQVYQALSSIEAWLPEGDRQIEQIKSYHAAWHALNILLFYFSETALRFDRRYYGSWPSACPLFDFQDADTAAGNLRLLVRLLFHPGLKVAFREHRNNQVRDILSANRTLTSWFFILQGKGEKSAPGRDNGAGATETQFDAKAVGDLLLEQVTRTLSQPQQDGLLLHWRERSREFLKDLNDKLYGSPEWRGLAWRRDLIIELTAKYERLRGGAGDSR